MPQRVSLIFQLTTAPTQLNYSIPHTGGWSEATWLTQAIPNLANYLTGWAQIRAVLLPKQAAIVGARMANYTISGNKLLPGGTNTYKFLYDGNAAYSTDVPQMALECSGAAVGAPNANRFTLRGTPDVEVQFGEYQPDVNYAASVSNYLGFLTGNQHVTTYPATGFIGRVLNNTVARIQSVTPVVIQGIQCMNVLLSQDIGARPNQDYLRFHRALDQAGNPIKGSYLVTNQVGLLYTLQGTPNQTAVKPSGTARVDLINLFTYSAINTSRIVVRKVGRPSQAYRGRASNRTAA